MLHFTVGPGFYLNVAYAALGKHHEFVRKTLGFAAAFDAGRIACI